MRFCLGALVLAGALSAQTANPIRTVVGRLDLASYKAHIKGLAQFGDRMQGTPGNRDAIDWLEKQLRSFGYSNVERHRFLSGSGPLDNIYATKIGTTTPGEMYIVSAHMDGRGGGRLRTTTHPAAQSCWNWLAFWPILTSTRIAP